MNYFLFMEHRQYIYSYLQWDILSAEFYFGGRWGGRLGSEREKVLAAVIFP